MNRRDFLVLGMASTVLSQLSGCSSFFPRSGGRRRELAAFWQFRGKVPVGEARPSHLAFYDPLTSKTEVYPMPFTAHSIIQNEEEPERLYFVSKINTHMGVFNRKTNEMEKVAETPRGRVLYGHGVWDHQRSGFWASENDDELKTGFVVLRDRYFKELWRIETGGAWPHDVQWSKDGLLLVANAEGVNYTDYPSFAYIDVNKGKIVKLIHVNELKDIGAVTHFTQSKIDDRIFLGGLKGDFHPQSHIVVISNGVPRILPMPADPGFKGESNSLVHDHVREQLRWVNPMSGDRFLYDLKKDVLLETYRGEKCGAMIEVEDQVVMTLTKNSSFTSWKGNQMQPLAQIVPPIKDDGWGVHVFSLLKS